MITDLLERITGLLRKDFLFGSFLPTVLFAAATGLTVVGVLGAGSAGAWVDSWTPLQTTATTAVVSLTLLAFAYVLAALRSVIMRMWSGDVSLYIFEGFLLIGRFVQVRRYRWIEAQRSRPSHWQATKDEFRERVGAVWSTKRPTPSPEEKSELRALVGKLERIAGRAGDDPGSWALQGGKSVLDEIVRGFERYHGEHLGDVYRDVKRILDARSDQAKASRQEFAVRLDRSFGTLESVRATKLGNVVESYNHYPSKRYNLEGRIFWPHLRTVMAEGLSRSLAEQRILLDFSLAMATLSFLYALLALIGGPWLWYEGSLWVALTGLGVASGLIFYRVGVIAAESFGELVRAAYDLGRADLMKALGRPPATSLAVERGQWRELSQLAAYGESYDFTLAAPEEDG